jgi:ABC-2 type transport system permease protein
MPAWKTFLWSSTNMWRLIGSELKDHKWQILGYTLASILMLWLYVATFRSSQSSTQQLQELIKAYPKGLLDALGLSDLTLNTVEVYLNAKHFSLLLPMLAILLALSRAAGQVAGEIQSGTMGLLLALPLRRWRIFAAKYTAGLLTIGFFTAASVFSVIPLAAAYDIPTHFPTLFKAWVLMVLFMWAVYAASLAVSAWLSEAGRVNAVMGAVLVLSYAAHIGALIVEQVDWLKYGSIFYYFNTREVLANGQIMTSSVAVFSGIIIVGSAIALWRLSRRDMSV